MRISQLIEQLTRIQEEQGDLLVGDMDDRILSLEGEAVPRVFPIQDFYANQRAVAAGEKKALVVAALG